MSGKKTCPCVANTEDDYETCPTEIHVDCDDACGALTQPLLMDELRLTLEHYRDHQWVGGCSHGC